MSTIVSISIGIHRLPTVCEKIAFYTAVITRNLCQSGGTRFQLDNSTNFKATVYHYKFLVYSKRQISFFFVTSTGKTSL